MKQENIKRLVAALLLMVLAAVSFLGVAKPMSSPETYPGTLSYLDEKKETVLRLTAASTAASVAITLIPGDTATPIAEKLADLSSGFLLVISAIYLEKYLVTVMGYVAFAWLLPVAFLLLAANMGLKSEGVCRLAQKLAVLGIALAVVIPTGVWVSRMIEDTYGSSMEQTIAAAEQATQEAQAADEAAETEEDKGLLSGIFSAVTDSASKAAETFENVLNRFIEALAVLLVTSCLIPLLVLLFFLWLVKIVVGADIPLPTFAMGKNILNKRP